MEEWMGMFFCPLCKSEMDMFGQFLGNHGNPSIQVCWNCKKLFQITGLVKSDMRD